MKGTKLVRTVGVLADDAAALAAHFHVFVEFCPKASHVDIRTRFVDLHESDFITEFVKVLGGEVVPDVVSLVQTILVFPEGNQNLA